MSKTFHNCRIICTNLLTLCLSPQERWWFHHFSPKSGEVNSRPFKRIFNAKPLDWQMKYIFLYISSHLGIILGGWASYNQRNDTYNYGSRIWPTSNTNSNHFHSPHTHSDLDGCNLFDQKAIQHPKTNNKGAFYYQPKQCTTSEVNPLNLPYICVCWFTPKNGSHLMMPAQTNHRCFFVGFFFSEQQHHFGSPGHVEWPEPSRRPKTERSPPGCQDPRCSLAFLLKTPSFWGRSIDQKVIWGGLFSSVENLLYHLFCWYLCGDFESRFKNTYKCEVDILSQ